MLLLFCSVSFFNQNCKSCYPVLANTDPPPHSQSLSASPCMDDSEAAATARCLKLNIALPQTEWCHHWADVLHNNCPPMWSLFQKKKQKKNWSEPIGWQDDVRLCACMLLEVYLFVSVCARALPLPSPLYPGSTLPSLTACVSSFFTLWALAEAFLNKHRITSHHRCLCCMHQHTPQKSLTAARSKHRYMWMLSFQRL